MAMSSTLRLTSQQKDAAEKAMAKIGSPPAIDFHHHHTEALAKDEEETKSSKDDFSVPLRQSQIQKMRIQRVVNCKFESSSKERQKIGAACKKQWSN